MNSGLYIIFEGNDGAGKTTTMSAVANSLISMFPHLRDDIILTHHPGSTPLGKHIRKLVKNSEIFDVPNCDQKDKIMIDDLSRQVLYMVDTISFIKSILEPSLLKNKIVLADRSSFVSALVYGLADGLNIYDIGRLFDIVATPRADKLYILQCPWHIGKNRINSERNEKDHYDNKPNEFATRIENIYRDLLVGPYERTALISKIISLDNIKYIDTTIPQSEVIKSIADDIAELIAGHY